MMAGRTVRGGGKARRGGAARSFLRDDGFERKHGRCWLLSFPGGGDSEQSCVSSFERPGFRVIPTSFAANHNEPQEPNKRGLS